MGFKIFDVYPRIPIFTVLLLFTITFFVYSDFGIRMIFGYAALLYILLMYLIFRNNNIRLTGLKVLYLVLTAALCVFPMIGNVANVGIYILSVAICSAVAVAGDIRRNEVKTAVTILGVFSVLTALYVLAVRIHPDVYYSLVRPHLTLESQQANDSLLRGGYGISLGGNMVYIDYVLTLCGMICFNIILAYKGTLKHKWLYWGCLGACVLGMLVVNRKSEMLSFEMEKPSYVKCQIIAGYTQRDVIRKFGVIKQPYFDEIIDKIIESIF